MVPLAAKYHDGKGGVWDIPDGVDAIAFVQELRKAMGLGDLKDESTGRMVRQWACPEGVDEELFQWWMDCSYEDLARTAPKAAEYGGTAGPATDLLLIGRNLAELCGLHEADDALLMELGVWFYMQGKVARLVADYQQKRPGKADTWFDAEIYAKMARRIQETGQWP